MFCRYNFFELDTSSEDLKLTNLFKSGQTIFLTDQVLHEEADAVIGVIKYVKERNKDKLPGTESRKVFARPCVTEWLLKLVEDNSDGPEARKNA